MIPLFLPSPLPNVCQCQIREQTSGGAFLKRIGYGSTNLSNRQQLPQSGKRKERNKGILTTRGNVVIIDFLFFLFSSSLVSTIPLPPALFFLLHTCRHIYSSYAHPQTLIDIHMHTHAHRTSYPLSPTQPHIVPRHMGHVTASPLEAQRVFQRSTHPTWKRCAQRKVTVFS